MSASAVLNVELGNEMVRTDSPEFALAQYVVLYSMKLVKEEFRAVHPEVPDYAIECREVAFAWAPGARILPIERYGVVPTQATGLCDKTLAELGVEKGMVIILDGVQMDNKSRAFVCTMVLVSTYNRQLSPNDLPN